MVRCSPRVDLAILLQRNLPSQVALRPFFLSIGLVPVGGRHSLHSVVMGPVIPPLITARLLEQPNPMRFYLCIVMAPKWIPILILQRWCGVDKLCILVPTQQEEWKRVPILSMN